MYDLNEINSYLSNYLNEKGITDLKSNFKCLIHQDDKASVKYYSNDNHIHCFGACNKSYKLIDLYAQIENKSINDSISELAQKYNINNNDNITKSNKYKIDYTKQYQLWNEQLNKIYPNGVRGISIKTLNKYNIGYKENCIYQNNNVGNYFILPNSNNSYNSRNVDLNCDTSIKCLKSGSQEIFNITALDDNKPCFIVEGEFDALSIIECGYNAIAISGQAINKLISRIKLLNKVPTLIIAFDMDKPQIIKNAETLLSELKNIGVNAYIPQQNEDKTLKLYLKYKDANEAFCNDPDNFKLELLNAIKFEEQIIINEKESYLLNSNNYTALGFVERMRLKEKHVIPTGFNNLDQKLDGGLYSGLYIVGGATGTGKTSFVMQIANNIASIGFDVLIIALEMRKDELIARDISRQTYILSGNNEDASTPRSILNPNKNITISVNRYKTLYDAEAIYTTYASNIYTFEGIGDVKVEDVRNKVINHIKYTNNKPVVIVDYLQILAPTNDKQSDKWNVDKSILELKRISRDYDIPVIAISSLNRESYKNRDKDGYKIDLTAFKESGSIEYGSDIVMALDLLNSDESINNQRELEINILKNRNGRIGTASKMIFKPLFNYLEEIN